MGPILKKWLVQYIRWDQIGPMTHLGPGPISDIGPGPMWHMGLAYYWQVRNQGPKQTKMTQKSSQLKIQGFIEKLFNYMSGD